MRNLRSIEKIPIEAFRPSQTLNFISYKERNLNKKKKHILCKIHKKEF